MFSYKVEIISQKEKDKIMFALLENKLFERKVSVHGTCIKFFTDSEVFKNMWTDNFKSMLDEIRPHGRIFAISDGRKKLKIQYEPISKTIIIRNCDYYGWIKSIALGLVGEFFEDFTSENRRYSIHGSFIDFGGRGVGIVGASGSGKTTLTYGLLLDKRYNFMTDDWFFVKIAGENILTFSSEKNSYIREGLDQIWPEFKAKIKEIKKDNHGRSIVDVRTVFGLDRIREVSDLNCMVLLTRDRSTDVVVKKLTQKEAIEFMVKNDFCNPHQLIRNKKKTDQRKKFFYDLFGRVPVYLLNTIETPKETLKRLKSILFPFYI